jgi:hypothetical protein
MRNDRTAPPRRRGPAVRAYNTQFDATRRRYGLDPKQWPHASHVSRGAISRYRVGVEEPLVETLARLVRAARQLSGRPVKASEFFDLGEAEPINLIGPKPARWHFGKTYDTRFDKNLIRERVLPAQLARESGVLRATILRKPSGADSITVGMLAKFVRAMRRIGRATMASDSADLGEDQNNESTPPPTNRGPEKAPATPDPAPQS